jgi:molybdopterin converting factor small subunit
MKIQLKLMGMLKKHAPDDHSLELPDGATIEDALHVLKVPVESVQVFTVNGKLERDKSRVLGDNDELSIIPPVGGG